MYMQECNVSSVCQLFQTESFLEVFITIVFECQSLDMSSDR